MEKHRGRYGRDLRVGLLAAVLLSACMSTPEAPTDDQAASMPAAQVEEGMSHTEDAQASIAGALILPLKSPIPGCEVAPIDLVKLGGAEFANPPAIYSTGGVLSAKLNVQYGQNQIGNCPVTLRSYNGSLVGPTLVITPGDTLRVTLVNQLPAGAIAFTKTITPSNGVAVTETIEVPAQPHHVMNQLGAFNTTNLHVHGLHVSPAGNSDNVLLEIGPGQTFQYEIKVPKNQPPGTYWYHAHNHGSTATQVTSGMAGAIVITGDYAKVDLIKKAHERVFVLQQIAYDEAGFVEPATGGTWTLPFNPNFPPGYFSPCAWEPTLREHTINGQLFPKLEMAAGEVQRWRFIHAGVRESIGLELHGPFPPNATPTYTDVLSSPALTLTEIAADGIALGAPAPWKQVELEPGYRSDMLVQALKPGVYYLMDNGVQVTTTSRDSSTGAYTTTTQSSDALTCAGFNETPNFLAKVDVKSPVVGMPPAPFKLPAAWPASPMKSIISVMTTEAFSRSLGLTNTVSLTQAMGALKSLSTPTTR